MSHTGCKKLSRVLEWMLCGVVFMPLSPFASAQASLPEGEGREIVESVCGQCHALTLVTSSRRTSEEWKQLVDNMVRLGAPLYGDEVELVTHYLCQQLGKEDISSSDPD